MALGIGPIGNLLGTVNANGALLVTLDGGAATATTMTVDTLKFDVANADTILVRDAANTLALKNGTNAQILRIYGTTTGSKALELKHDGSFGYVYTNTNLPLALGANNSANWIITGAGHFTAGADNTYDIGASGATRPRVLYLAGAVGQAGGVTSEGLTGVPVVAKVGRITAQSSNATIATLTTPAVDGSYEVSANMNVTGSTTLVTTLTCTYTDESNTARSMIFPVIGVSGSFIAAGAITGAGATVWETPMIHIRVKASTAITILTSAGTFTGVTYTADAVIKQMK